MILAVFRVTFCILRNKLDSLSVVNPALHVPMVLASSSSAG